MITSNVTTDIDLPHEPGVKITIRMLSHGALKKARDVRMSDLAQMIGKIDMSTIPSGRDAEKEADEEQERDPLIGYDLTTVLHKGIKAWSYPEKLNPENIDELDDETAQFIGREIVKLSRRDRKTGEASSER